MWTAICSATLIYFSTKYITSLKRRYTLVIHVKNILVEVLSLLFKSGNIQEKPFWCDNEFIITSEMLLVFS